MPPVRQPKCLNCPASNRRVSVIDPDLPVDNPAKYWCQLCRDKHEKKAALARRLAAQQQRDGLNGQKVHRLQEIYTNFLDRLIARKAEIDLAFADQKLACQQVHKALEAQIPALEMGHLPLAFEHAMDQAVVDLLVPALPEAEDVQMNLL